MELHLQECTEALNIRSPIDSECPEVDAKFYSESNWKNQNSFFLQNARKDGIVL